MDKIQRTGLLFAFLGAFMGLPVMLAVIRHNVNDLIELFSITGVGLICFGVLLFCLWTLVKIRLSSEDTKGYAKYVVKD